MNIRLVFLVLLMSSVFPKITFAQQTIGEPCSPADPTVTCSAGLICGDLGFCTNPQTDSYNCGSVGTRCSALEVCVSGQCCQLGPDVSDCPGGGHSPLQPSRPLQPRKRSLP